MAQTNDTVTNTTQDEKRECTNAITSHVATIAVYILGFILLLLCCKGLHFVMRTFLSQPRIISEFIVGLFLANIPFVRDAITSTGVSRTLNYLGDFGMVIHTFVLGLEIDYHPYIISPFREVKVAFAGLISTFLLVFLVNPLLHLHQGGFTRYGVCLALVVSGTASPLLTRLITDLKIGKSDIGRFVVLTGVLADLVIMVLLAIGFVVFNPMHNYEVRSLKDIAIMLATLVVELVVAAKVTPFLFRWVNRENPEGKQMKGSHLILSVAYVVVLCGCSPVVGGFNTMLSSLLAGVFMPREGRISKMMIAKINFLLSVIFYPLLLFWVGVEADFSMFGLNTLWPWLRFILLFAVTTIGKVLGSLISGVTLGFHWRESVAIGLLLNIKGHIHVYLATIAAKNEITSVSTSMAMLFAAVLTVVYTPLVVNGIIERARKRSPTQLMALQWLDPQNELRILVCLNGPQNVPSAVNIGEISRGQPEPGIMVFVADMVELTDRVAATLIHGDGKVAITVTDQGVIAMREEIGKLLHAYATDEREGITITRKLAIATINNMHQDICILAEELNSSMVIMPFHKEQKQDGRLGLGHSGFRHVNRKVLRHAACSVGILVDRGLGSANRLSRTSGTLNAAVIFIGGKDDREALAFSSRMALHPGVKLTVIRFLVEVNTEEGSEKPGRPPRVKTHKYEEEMKLDDEGFADFYDTHVARGRVSYMEKHLVNSSQTFSTLRSMEGQYSLFIVGRGGRVNSVLTMGMNDWEECPELGPIGDILSASDFSVTTSVLIIQQHSLKGELVGLDDEFSVM